MKIIVIRSNSLKEDVESIGIYKIGIGFCCNFDSAIYFGKPLIIICDACYTPI